MTVEVSIPGEQYIADYAARHIDVTARHEAGHAVAALMRGGGQLLSITIEPADDYLGRTETRVKPWGSDAAFGTFAGPWAEARYRWPCASLDDIDGDGCTFEDYLLAAWMSNADGDERAYEDHLDRERAQYGAEIFAEHVNAARREACWSRELEGMWPVIEAVAAMLLAGDIVDHDTVAELIEEHWESATE